MAAEWAFFKLVFNRFCQSDNQEILVQQKKCKNHQIQSTMKMMMLNRGGNMVNQSWFPRDDPASFYVYMAMKKLWQFKNQLSEAFMLQAMQVTNNAICCQHHLLLPLASKGYHPPCCYEIERDPPTFQEAIYKAKICSNTPWYQPTH